MSGMSMTFWGILGITEIEVTFIKGGLEKAKDIFDT
jgi:hypothetical protein